MRARRRALLVAAIGVLVAVTGVCVADGASTSGGGRPCARRGRLGGARLGRARGAANAAAATLPALAVMPARVFWVSGRAARGRRGAPTARQPPPRAFLPPAPPDAAPATRAARSLLQSTRESRCRVLALPCVSSVYVQAGETPCAGPPAFGRDNACCPVVRDFVAAGCACDGAFLAIASFGGWNGVKLAQAARAVLGTPCGAGLKDPACGLVCPMPKAAPAPPLTPTPPA